jgi:hypothetical protein
MLAASLFVTVSPHANAAIIDFISNLDINGTAYDVTFHTDSVSFNDLWDADDDGIFGGGSSIFSSQPAFWLDKAAALAAQSAVILELGTLVGWNSLYDSLVIPCGTNGDCTTSITAFRDIIFSSVDGGTSYSDDSVNFAGLSDIQPRGGIQPNAYASFTLSGAAPSPITPALLIPGLVAIAGIRKRRKKASN